MACAVFLNAHCHGQPYPVFVGASLLEIRQTATAHAAQLPSARRVQDFEWSKRVCFFAHMKQGNEAAQVTVL
jgi:hypothetical protein